MLHDWFGWGMTVKLRDVKHSTTTDIREMATAAVKGSPPMFSTREEMVQHAVDGYNAPRHPDWDYSPWISCRAASGLPE